jgi:Sigma-70 region 2
MGSDVRSQLEDLKPALSRFDQFQLRIIDTSTTSSEEKNRRYQKLLDRHLSQFPGGNLSSTDEVSGEERDIAEQKFRRVIRRRAFMVVLNRDGRQFASSDCGVEQADLRQQGILAVWQAMAKHRDGDEMGFAMVVARHAMVDVARKAWARQRIVRMVPLPTVETDGWELGYEPAYEDHVDRIRLMRRLGQTPSGRSAIAAAMGVDVERSGAARQARYRAVRRVACDR